MSGPSTDYKAKLPEGKKTGRHWKDGCKDRRVGKEHLGV
jgi:hypothetical protein